MSQCTEAGARTITGQECGEGQAPGVCHAMVLAVYTRQVETWESGQTSTRGTVNRSQGGGADNDKNCGYVSNMYIFVYYLKYFFSNSLISDRCS